MGLIFSTLFTYASVVAPPITTSFKLLSGGVVVTEVVDCLVVGAERVVLSEGVGVEKCGVVAVVLLGDRQSSTDGSGGPTDASHVLLWDRNKVHSEFSLLYTKYPQLNNSRQVCWHLSAVATWWRSKTTSPP